MEDELTALLAAIATQHKLRGLCLLFAAFYHTIKKCELYIEYIDFAIEHLLGSSTYVSVHMYCATPVVILKSWLFICHDGRGAAWRSFGYIC